MISVEISKDALEAYVILQYVPEEYNNDRAKLVNAIQHALKNANINYGILQEVFQRELPLNTPVLIARGKPPVHGRDSEIKMYQIPEPKPQIIDDGKVNYYNLNLIHHVKAGDWLGERLDPIPGVPGVDVHGNEIKPNEGITYPLLFDEHSVTQVRLEGKDVLYAIKDGAVHYVNDVIAVYDVMEIQGNVDFNTGNIEFDGYIRVEGTVEENFTVIATKDIEISGVYGIGGAKLIESKEGSIYIRGGVAGKGKAIIKCKGNLYAKFISDAEIICEGSVYIGFYVRNCLIRAKQVIVDSGKGQIAGGSIDADIRVECADIGNRMERRTLINIRGFNRDSLKNEMDELLNVIQAKKNQLNDTREILMSYCNDTQKNKSGLKKIQHKLTNLQEEIKKLESQCLNITNYLKTPGEGAVVVKNYIYPKVRITIQNNTLEIDKQEYRPTYISRNGIVDRL
mgnify:FL=1